MDTEALNQHNIDTYSWGSRLQAVNIKGANWESFDKWIAVPRKYTKQNFYDQVSEMALGKLYIGEEQNQMFCEEQTHHDGSDLQTLVAINLVVVLTTLSFSFLKYYFFKVVSKGWCCKWSIKLCSGMQVGNKQMQVRDMDGILDELLCLHGMVELNF